MHRANLVLLTAKTIQTKYFFEYIYLYRKPKQDFTRHIEL